MEGATFKPQSGLISGIQNSPSSSSAASCISCQSCYNVASFAANHRIISSAAAPDHPSHFGLWTDVLDRSDGGELGGYRDREMDGWMLFRSSII